MSEYKVEKDHFPVTLFFLDGTEKEGDIFLSLHAAEHEGHELAVDVLNQREQFIPVQFKDERVGLIRKRNILMISFPLDQQGPEYSVFADVTVEVAIHLVTHRCLEGNFFFVLPLHARRVKDFLNQPEPFVELRKDKEVYLVNKDHVLSVEEKSR